MSVKNILFLFLALALSYGLYGFVGNERPQKTHFFHLSSFVGLGPTQQTIKVKLKTSDISEDDSDTVTVKALVSLPFNFSGELSYKWMLGDQVILTSGPLEGTLKNFNANDPQTVELAVKNFSKKQLRHVAFRISGQKDGRKISADSIVASDMEKTFERVVTHVERLKQEENNE